MPLILFFPPFLDVVVCDTEETNARYMDNFCCKSTVVHGKVKRLRLGSWFMENYGCQKRPKKEDKRHSWLNVQDSFFQTTLRRHHSRKLHHDDCDKTLWLVCTASHTIEGTTHMYFSQEYGSWELEVGILLKLVGCVVWGCYRAVGMAP